MNDGISKESSSLLFVTIEDMVATVRKQGRGGAEAKMNIKQAYCKISAHLQDRLLMGVQVRQCDGITGQPVPFPLDHCQKAKWSS